MKKNTASKAAKPAPRPSRARRADVERDRVAQILDVLDREYPSAQCSLDHRNPFELLTATILSAQCTDARVNIVTKELFRECPDAAALDRTPLARVEEIVKSTGFFRNKAKSLKGMARRLLEHHGGDVPRSFDDLLTLPGVARKTANVVLGTGFGVASGVVVDTHVGRISKRLGLTRESDPVKIERDLARILPPERWIRFSHQLIEHGRAICTALRPKCERCPLRELCPSADRVLSSTVGSEAWNSRDLKSRPH